MPIKINGSTSGSVTLTAPASGSDVTVTLPTDLNAKSPSASPTFTGTVTLTGATVVGLPAAGMTLVTASSFSAASNVSVNSCFSSTYDNYRISLQITSLSTNLALFLRLRVAGTDSSSAYQTEVVENYGSTVSAATNPNADGTKFVILTNSSPTYAENCAAVLDLLTPGIAKYTNGFARSNIRTSGGVFVSSSFSYFHVLSTAYDGFSLLTSTGNMTGTVRVYGYQNS